MHEFYRISKVRAQMITDGKIMTTYIYILMRLQIKVVFQRPKQPGVVTTNFDDRHIGYICDIYSHDAAEEPPRGKGTNDGAEPTNRDPKRLRSLAQSRPPRKTTHIQPIPYTYMYRYVCMNTYMYEYV